MVYTPGQHVEFSYKLSKFSPNPQKYHNLKEVYAFELSKQVQFRRQNGTLPRTKFPSVNRQPKSSQKTARNQIFKTLKRAQKVSKNGKYQGKFIYTVFIIEPWGLSAPPKGGEPWGLSAPPKGGEPWGLSAPPKGGEPWGLSAPPKGGEPWGVIVWTSDNSNRR